MNPGEIWYIFLPYLRRSERPHFALVVARNGDLVTAHFISTYSGRGYGESGDLTIDSASPDFKSTGLKETSFLVSADNGGLFSKSISEIKTEKERRGFVSGALRKKIEGDFWGAPLK
jgi:hypothetical protein